MAEKRKKHIERLPITQYPDYSITRQNVAITIPLFHSPVDSGFTVFDEQRIKDIHVKGAIWVALSLINNTDLADQGVGIYFHLEDKIYDIAKDVFDKFGVPDKFIRVMTITDFQSEGVHAAQYGKKYMFLEDDLKPEQWVMMDSDAFVCTTGEKFRWYDCFRSFSNPSAMNAQSKVYHTEKEYAHWVEMCSLAAGFPYQPKEDLAKQEKQALLKLEVPEENLILGPSQDERAYTCSQILVLPTSHALVDYIKRHWKSCHWDEGMLNVWHMMHSGLSFLPAKLGGLPKFTFESEYVNRDKSLDDKGYLAHILPDNRVEELLVDEYMDDFYEALQPKNYILQKSYSNASVALANSKSDKEHVGAHRYGMLYDFIFDAVLMRQGRNLRVLEIGVSLFGEGSLKAYQDMEIVEEVVGIDTEDYTGHLSLGTTFYQYDAYTQEMIDTLKQKHKPFDIIIDDGSHKTEHQEFFLLNYDKVLADGGVLICEDVDDRDFFRRMHQEHGCYALDGWAHRANKAVDGVHDERVLIRSKPRKIPKIEVQSVSDKFTTYKPKSERLALHVFDIPYSNEKIHTCAYIQRVRKFCDIMHKMGHEIKFYGHEHAKVVCDEHIPVTNDSVLKEAYGSSDYVVVPSNQRSDDVAFKTFNENAEREYRKRAKENDFVLAFYGWGHKRAGMAISDLPCYVVEPSMGYVDGTFKYRVQQSNIAMGLDRGIASRNHVLHQKFKEDKYAPLHAAGEGNRRTQNEASWDTFVMPNFYNLNQFTYDENKDDYILFLGRVHQCKGIEIAFNLAEWTNTRLIVAGPGDINSLGIQIPPQVEYVGIADPPMRSDLYQKAIATICPSLYLEPGLGVAVETCAAGAPPITTNWGAPYESVRHGVTGYRCHSFDHFVWALENIDKIDPKACRHHAMQYSSEKAAISYHEIFHTILQNANDNFWNVNPDRNNLDWLSMDMTESEIQGRFNEISHKVKLCR